MNSQGGGGGGGSRRGWFLRPPWTRLGQALLGSPLTFLTSPSTPLARIEKVVETINDSIPIIEWDFEGTHYFDNGPVTVQYLLVLDALIFCFWPVCNAASAVLKSPKYSQIKESDLWI
ncbi:unnamed protein product [Camellia sinensis]